MADDIDEADEKAIALAAKNDWIYLYIDLAWIYSNNRRFFDNVFRL